MFVLYIKNVNTNSTSMAWGEIKMVIPFSNTLYYFSWHVGKRAKDFFSYVSIHFVGYLPCKNCCWEKLVVLLDISLNLVYNLIIYGNTQQYNGQTRTKLGTSFQKLLSYNLYKLESEDQSFKFVWDFLYFLTVISF